MKKLVVLAVGIVMASFGAALSQPAEPVPVTADNFSRAETDVTMAAYVKMGALGKLLHAPELASIDDQKIVDKFEQRFSENPPRSWHLIASIGVLVLPYLVLMGLAAFLPRHVVYRTLRTVSVTVRSFES